MKIQDIIEKGQTGDKFEIQHGVMKGTIIRIAENGEGKVILWHKRVADGVVIKPVAKEWGHGIVKLSAGILQAEFKRYVTVEEAITQAVEDFLKLISSEYSRRYGLLRVARIPEEVQDYIKADNEEFYPSNPKKAQELYTWYKTNPAEFFLIVGNMLKEVE